MLPPKENGIHFLYFIITKKKLWKCFVLKPSVVLANGFFYN